MSKVNARAVLDLFGYVILSAPDFPEEDETITDVEIAGLADAIRAIQADEASWASLTRDSRDSEIQDHSSAYR